MTSLNNATQSCYKGDACEEISTRLLKYSQVSSAIYSYKMTKCRGKRRENGFIVFVHKEFRIACQMVTKQWYILHLKWLNDSNIWQNNLKFWLTDGKNHKISHRTTLKCFHSYYDNRLTVPLITCQILFKYLQGVSAQPLKVTLALKGTCCADFQLHITILQYLNTKCNFWQHRKEVRGSNKPFCCLLKHIHPSIMKNGFNQGTTN